MTVRFKPTPRELRSLLLYLIDWIFVGGTAIVAFAFGKLTPNLRPFSIDDATISYSYQEHTKIPTWLLAVLSTIVPGVFIALSVLLLPQSRGGKLKIRLWQLNTAWLGLGVAIAAAMLVTNGMKNLVGKHRPDLISRCAPDPERLASGGLSVVNRYLFDVEICTSWGGVSEAGLGRDELLDGFRSWVSGHTSISYAGLTYLTIFLSFHFPKPRGFGRFNNTSEPQAPKKSSHLPIPLLLVLSVPVLLATYVATTRYSDYRHHGVDVIFGSLLGVGMAILGWTCYGSRTTNGAQGFGGFSRKRTNRRCGDLELGRQQPTATDQSTYLDAQAEVQPNGEGEAAKGGDSIEAPGQLIEGVSKGALQLREMSLSISTIDGPEDAYRRKSN
ncbi:acid phosphatase/Vanadium-dependent haloperoxidase [Terfezia boudieri ATCC MYA-4762]|uniref:Acid phosphatase/Vanadium-dependent haloperoxidase n=1 Tax=Terfezia boudieri ATCC MYA-4762 TaxID=1051890 RepID=A0A3N4M326_9PEZI|nr:acid phosphatase/Vanadium-dependent haloperoxidase [Terfezia boudieri ATCC MYA-4762]